MMRTLHSVGGNFQTRSAREQPLVKSIVGLIGLTGLTRSNRPDSNQKKKEPGKGMPGIKIFTFLTKKNIYEITDCPIELDITYSTN